MPKVGGGNLWFGVGVKDETDKGLSAIRDKLTNLSLDIKNVNTSGLIGNINSALSQYTASIAAVANTGGLQSSLDAFFSKYTAQLVKFQVDKQALSHALQSQMESAYRIAVSPKVVDNKVINLTPNKDIIQRAVRESLANQVFSVKVRPDASSQSVNVKADGKTLRSSVAMELNSMSATVNVTAKMANNRLNVVADEKVLRKSVQDIMNRLNSESQKLKINAVLNNPTVKVAVDESKVSSDISNAIKRGAGSKGYPVNIYIDRMKMAQAVRTALQQLQSQGFSGNTLTSQLKAEKILTEQAKQSAQIALAENRRSKAAGATTKAYLSAKGHLSATVPVAGNLADTINRAFSAILLKEFFLQLVKIGGEFQKQHVALQTMLGDAAQADKIFSQLKNLAIESPFKFSDLTKFGKQLAAYSVPYEELYDTTKRLSDISAGLGVDMQRIILAYGQIRSAKVLKGTELRQLTEAGIPMVDALAKKLSQLEGQVVSTGEVFKRISNKEISFDMVKDILWQMTDAGGQFYNMQEKLTNTLSGQWDKFVDAFEISMADMAESSQGTLNIIISLFASLAKNLDTIARIVMSAATAFLALRAAMAISWVIGFARGFANIATSARNLEVAMRAARIASYAKNFNVLATSMVSGNIAALRLLATLKAMGAANLIVAGITAIATVALALYTYFSNAEEEAQKLNKELGRIRSTSKGTQSEMVYGYASLVTQLSKTTEGTTAYKEIIDKMNSTYGQYLDKLYDENTAYKEIADSVDKVTQAIIAKKKAEALDQEIAQISETYSEPLADAQAEIQKRLKIEFKLDDATAKKMASGITNLIEGGMTVSQAVGSVADDFGKAANLLNKAVMQSISGRGENVTFGNITKRESIEKIVDQYYDILEERNEKYAESTSYYDYDIGQEQVKAINEEYAELEKNSKGENERLAVQLEMHRKILEYLKSRADIPRNDKRINDEEQAIAKLEARTQGWVEKANELANQDVFNAVLDKSFKSKKLAPSDDEMESTMTYLGRIAEEYVKIKDTIAELEKAPKMIQATISWQMEWGKAKTDQQQYEAMAQFLGIDDLSSFADSNKKKNTTGGSSSKDALAEDLKERTSLIKEAYSEYKKWLQVMSRDSALKQVMESGLFDQLFKGKRMISLDDYRRELDRLQKEAEAALRKANTKERRSALNNIIKMTVEFDYDISKDKLDAALRRIEEEIAQQSRKWDIFKKFFELTGDREQSMQIAFGNGDFIGKNIDSWTKYLSTEINSLLSKKDIKGVDISSLFTLDEKGLREKFSGLDGEEIGLLQNLLKEYKKAQETDAQEQKDLYYKALEDTAGYYEKRLQITQKYQKMIDAATKEGDTETANKLKAKRDSELEEMSPDVSNFYSAALTLTEEKMRLMAQTLKENLMKQFVAGTITADQFYKKLKQINTVEQGFETNRNAWNQLTALDLMTPEGRGKGYDLLIDEYEQRIVSLSTKLEEYRSIEENTAEGTEEHENAVRDAAEYTKQLADAQQALNRITKKKVSNDKTNAAMAEMFQIGDAAMVAANSIGNMFSALGNDSVADSVGTFTDVAGGVLEGAKAGAAFGPWGAAAGAAIGAITSIANQHDKRLDKAINKSKERVMDLKLAYQELATVIKHQLGATTTRQNEQQVKNLQKQLEETQFQLRAEQDKKKSDAGAIADYKSSMAELREQIKYYYEELANEQYGADIKSWASDLADALVDAFSTGEDAAKAFDDTVAGILNSLAKEAINMQFIQPAMDELREYMFGKGGIFMNDSAQGSSLSTGEMAGLAERLKSLKTTLAGAESYWNMINDATGGLLESTEKASSGLSAGISSVTEETADLLASYINAIRADVSQERYMLSLIHEEDYPQQNAIMQAQLQQLQQIASNTRISADKTTEIMDFLSALNVGTKKISVK